MELGTFLFQGVIDIGSLTSLYLISRFVRYKCMICLSTGVLLAAVVTTAALIHWQEAVESGELFSLTWVARR